MTHPNGARREHDGGRRRGSDRTHLAGDLSRRTDGRWTDSRHQADATAVDAPDPATTELAVTKARDGQTDADWDAVNEYDAAFEEASSRFFETDPGKRPAYENLMADDVEPEVVVPEPSPPRGPSRQGSGYIEHDHDYPQYDYTDEPLGGGYGYGHPNGAHGPAEPFANGSARGSAPGYPTGHGQGYEAVSGDPVADSAVPEVDEEELATGAAARRNAIEWAVVLVAAVLLALVLRALVLQAFYIPSPSMEDTLLIQDRVLVNKLSYRFGEVGRGDIVVFHRTDEEIAAAGPSQPKDVIKRVIAFGGETIEIRESRVFIDDQELLEPYLEPGLVMPDFGPLTVPEGFLFVMGDNRNLSSDSRGELGPIAEERVVGRAFVLFWPVNRVTRL